jgi:hypothetical protein
MHTTEMGDRPEPADGTGSRLNEGARPVKVEIAPAARGGAGRDRFHVETLRLGGNGADCLKH